MDESAYTYSQFIYYLVAQIFQWDGAIYGIYGAPALIKRRRPEVFILLAVADPETCNLFVWVYERKGLWVK